MEGKAIMKTLKVFSGKQKDYNLKALTLLYDNGPLTAWELTAKIPSARGGRISLHATLNKRLRQLEKKGYIRREDKKWYLGFKGIIAVLLILKKPKKWNPEWKEVFDKRAKIIERDAAPFLEKYGIPKEDIHSGLKGIGLTLDDFDAWVGLSNTAKSLIDNGMMDFDVIKESTLMGLLIMESMTPLEISEIWNEKT
jgi:DNA-binding HxlR family transcriptional regulator